MDVIHFTKGATDPLLGFRAHDIGFVPLADGAGADETYVSCLHLGAGGWVSDPPSMRDSAILIVQGTATFTLGKPRMRLKLVPGVGVVVNADDRYRLESDLGAIVIVIESECLEATELAISTPDRICGQTWPGESVISRRRTLLSAIRSLYHRMRWSLPSRLWPRTDSSGWRPKASGKTTVERLLSFRKRNPPPR